MQCELNILPKFFRETTTFPPSMYIYICGPSHSLGLVLHTITLLQDGRSGMPTEYNSTLFREGCLSPNSMRPLACSSYAAVVAFPIACDLAGFLSNGMRPAGRGLNAKASSIDQNASGPIVEWTANAGSYRKWLSLLYMSKSDLRLKKTAL